MSKYWYNAFALVCFYLFLPGHLLAEETQTGPGALISSTVQEVRDAVVHNQGKLSTEELDLKLKEIIAKVFDFREMARRALGANWNKGTEDQQKEYVDLFSALLAKNYLRRIRDNVSKSTVTLKGERMKGQSALVKTVVDTEGDIIAIDYQMLPRDGKWFVYDVVIENIGLVSNYRSEFAGIIQNEKFEGLLERLRKK